MDTSDNIGGSYYDQISAVPSCLVAVSGLPAALLVELALLATADHIGGAQHRLVKFVITRQIR